MNSFQTSRRNLLRNTLLATSGVALGSIAGAADEPDNQSGGLKGRIKQSASRWCYGKIPLDDLCEAGKKMGLKGLDLLGPDAFPTLKKHGLVCTMTSGFGNIIQPADHDKGVEKVINSIQANAEAGFPNVIVLAGYRKDIPDDDVGMTNAVTFLKRVAGLAEEKGICICMEYLNSKVDHKGYIFDNMAWVPRLSSVSVRPTSRSSMIFTTPRSWREISSAPSARTRRSSATTIQEATPGAMKSTRRRRFFTRRSCARSWKPAMMAMWRTNLCPSVIP